MNDKETCGEYYRRAMDEFRMYKNYDDVFAIGFVCGQAEKVMIHACEAAMCRPSADRAPFLFNVLARVSGLYGLTVHKLEYEQSANLQTRETIVEYWLCRDARAVRTVESLESMEINGPAWHVTRASLCGIPTSDVDYRFHERQGFGKRCD